MGAPTSHQVRGRTGLCQAERWKEEGVSGSTATKVALSPLKPLILSALWVAGGWGKADTSGAAIPVWSLGKVEQQTKGRRPVSQSSPSIWPAAYPQNLTGRTRKGRPEFMAELPKPLTVSF